MLLHALLLLVVPFAIAETITCTVYWSYCSLGGGAKDETDGNLNSGARTTNFVVDSADFPLSNPRVEYSDPGGVYSYCPSHCPLTAAAAGIDCSSHRFMDSHFTWDTARGATSDTLLVNNGGTSHISLYSHYTCAMPPASPPSPPSMPPTSEVLSMLLERVSALEAQLERVSTLEARLDNSCLHSEIDNDGLCKVTPTSSANGIKLEGDALPEPP